MAAEAKTPEPKGMPEGERPHLGWLAVGDCHVDERYQRDTGSRRSQRLIELISERFDWRRFGAVLAMPWPEKKGWSIIDGQHRLEGARRRGVAEIPGLVYPAMPVAEAAVLFAAFNRDRVTVTPLHVYHAMLTAGDKETVAVAKACAAAGADVVRSPRAPNQLKHGQTMAVGALTGVLRAHGPGVLERTLRLLVEAWPTPGHLRGPLIRGLGKLLREHGAKIADRKMLSALATSDGPGWCAVAAAGRLEWHSNAEAAMANALGLAVGIRTSTSWDHRRDAGATLQEPASRRCATCRRIFQTLDLNVVTCVRCRSGAAG